MFVLYEIKGISKIENLSKMIELFFRNYDVISSCYILSVVNPLYFANANENVKQIDLISTFYDKNVECVCFFCNMVCVVYF